MVIVELLFASSLTVMVSICGLIRTVYGGGVVVAIILQKTYISFLWSVFLHSLSEMIVVVYYVSYDLETKS